ncbi:MAG: hypothetical protein JXA03_03995 [Bacteroidales bacterium]|nr:hypothetical protein [Bacteroidales bacterium]
MRTHIIIILTCLLLAGAHSHSQDVAQKLDEARSAYSSGDLESARFALQQALQEVNIAIGNEILALLPVEMGGMTKADDQDNVTGTNYGFAGLYLSRAYQSEDRDARLEIISDSPLLSGINALLAMPVFMGSGPDQKRIKIGGYKALLSRSEVPDGTVTYDVQMPFGSSLLTFNSNGIKEEKEVEEILGSIPVDQIVKLAQ